MQAKFGQYLQDAKNPRSISQTEKAVEREQIRSNEQILPTPGVCDILLAILDEFRPIPMHFSKCGANRAAATDLLQLGQTISIVFLVIELPKMSTLGALTIFRSS